MVRLQSAGREEEAAVWWDEAADLEHDLGTGPEAERAGVSAAADSVDVDGDQAAERHEPARLERLAPHAKETTERRRSRETDDSAWVERPRIGATTCEDDAAKAEARPLQPDPCRDNHNAPAGEQLDVNLRPAAQRRGLAREPGGRRSRGRVVSRSRSHGSRHRGRYGSDGPDREGAHVHRNQATRAVLCLLACVLLVALAIPSAKADGDPASDYLVAQQVFLSYDAKIPPALQRKLVAAVASANRNGFPIRVALIWSSYDLGSVPELFGKPQTYARFLDAEDSKCWWGASCGTGRFKTTTRLLVVMPKGLGFAQWKHDPAAGYQALKGIRVERTPAGLATAATTAVTKLAAASGVKVSTKGGQTSAPVPSGGGTSRTEIIGAVVVALLLGVAARLLIRRRAARSVIR
jgi:hypothetical protein